MFPFVYDYHKKNRNCFGDSMRRACQAYVSQTVDHQHGHNGIREYLFKIEKRLCPSFSITDFSKNSPVGIQIMEGIRKLSGPKIRRQIKEQISPRSEGICSFVCSHCSMKTTTNKAVMEKSIPAVLKVITFPRNPPRKLPTTQ